MQKNGPFAVIFGAKEAVYEIFLLSLDAMITCNHIHRHHHLFVIGAKGQAMLYW